MLFEKHTGFLRGRKRKPQLQKQLHVHPYYLLIYLFIKDRKSTRLNSSHGYISYAVFCLKKKKPRYAVRARPGELDVLLEATAPRRGHREDVSESYRSRRRRARHAHAPPRYVQAAGRASH